MKNVYVVSAVRTPVGKSGRGILRNMRPDDFASVAVKGAVERSGVDPNDLEDLVLGCAFPEGEQGLNVARMVALRAGLPETVCGATVNRYCSSGLETMAQVAAKIESGMLTAAIAGGVESMSLVPMGGNKPAPNPWLVDNKPESYIGMGQCGDNVARDFEITREDADKWGLRSNQRAAKAAAEGRFADEIVPLEVETPTGTMVMDKDEGPRPESTMEGLGKLRTAFAASPDRGVCTAGNSSQTSDGAAAAVLVSAEYAKKHNLKPIARLRGYAVRGASPNYLGPSQIPAIEEACRQAGITPADIGLVECNEAFATQTIHVVRHFGFDEEIVNVNGGAIALGHPLGCTGAKLAATLIHEMKKRGVKWGLETMCIGGGMGAAGIFENVDEVE